MTSVEHDATGRLFQRRERIQWETVLRIPQEGPSRMTARETSSTMPQSILQCMSERANLPAHMAEAAPKPQPKPARRLLLFSLVLIVLTPALTWISLQMLGGNAKPAAPIPMLAPKPYIELKAPSELPVPLVNTQVVFIRANPGKGVPPFFAPTNTPPVQGISKLTVQLADPAQTHYAVASIFLVAKNTDLLVHKLNEKQPQFYDAVVRFLSTKTLSDTRSVSFRQQLREELIRLSRAHLGQDAVDDVIISEFLAQ